MMKCFAWACLLGSLCAIVSARSAQGYIAMGRWGSTAQNPSTGMVGNAAEITWSIVPDGTWIPSKLAPSNLIAQLDQRWGAGPGGSDLTRRPWFGLFEEAMDRWSELGGVRFIYEPADDGLIWGTGPGVSGVRADLRIAGASIDGPLKKLGYNELPSNGDMLIDTDDMSYFGNSNKNHLRFRNHLMHEVGHGLGLGHVISHSSNFLMEPSNATAFDGPQFDDILGLHHLYGDRFEKANGGLGNNRREHAVPLGTVAPGAMVAVGTDATSNTVVSPDQTDFVSISNQYDDDYFSFRLSSSGRTTIALVPVGASYDVARQGGVLGDWETLSLSNLSLTLFDKAGTQLAIANKAPLGKTELLANLPLRGGQDYFVRVAGTGHMAQFYSLQIGMSHDDSASTQIVGDFNFDGLVDAADYTLWRNSLGQVGMGLPADANGNMVVDHEDYALWKQNLGASVYNPSLGLTGDFNNDGTVDAGDYTVWRNSVGMTGFGLAADANRDWIVDQKDYQFWKANFGAGSPAALAVAAAVPEPQSLGLLATLAFVAGGFYRATRRRTANSI